MLSFNNGREIATFTDGKMKNKKIYLKDENIMDKGESDILVPQKEKAQLVSKEWYKRRNVKPSVRDIIKENIENDTKLRDIDEKYYDIYDEALAEVDYRLKNELNYTDIKYKDKLFPIPQKFSERIYIPAPSGSGKSTFIGMYLKQLRLKYPNRKIFIFSRVPKDEPLDKFRNLERIELSWEEFEMNPLQVEDYKNGILIFDDIDTIINKKLVKYLRHFRDDVLEVGRHFGITCISTSHIITNFHATRTLINEANAIVLFPRGSSFHQIKNFLERYLGFGSEEVEYIRKLPSRWLWVWKEYPKYMIHEKGVILF